MDETRRRAEATAGPISADHVSLATPWNSSRSNSPGPAGNPLLHTLQQLQEFLSTAGILGFGIIIPLFWDWLTTKKIAKNFDPAQDVQSLEGKFVLVTGGNTGLGKQTIAHLSSHKPARIYLAARTASKAREAIADIQSSVPNACEIVHLPLDLSSFHSIAGCAAEFKARESRLDILINNAGVMAMPYSLTKDGYEIQFGTNHMGHALLTKLLLPTMLETAKQAGADVRVITITSIGHYLVPSKGIEFVQTAHEKINIWFRYGSSKLANILFARELAARYPSITSVSVHPGVVVTELYSSLQTNIFMRFGVWIYGYLAMILPGHYKDTKGGALSQIWCAGTPKANLQGGAFYMPVGVKNQGSAWSRNKGLQKKLWEWTESELQTHGY